MGAHDERLVLTRQSAGGLGSRLVASDKAPAKIPGDHLRWRHSEIPDQTYSAQHAQNVVGHIDLPPVEALRGRGLIIVVIVVPALAHRDDSEDEAVAAVFAGLVHPFAPDVGEGVDREGSVPQQNRAEHEANEQPRRAECRKNHCSECCWRYPPIAIKEHQLWVSGEVGDSVEVRGLVFGGEEPPHVRTIEPVLSRRVAIVGLVRELVVVAMMSRPPQDAFL